MKTWIVSSLDEEALQGEETIQGRKLYEEIRYPSFRGKNAMVYRYSVTSLIGVLIKIIFRYKKTKNIWRNNSSKDPWNRFFYEQKNADFLIMVRKSQKQFFMASNLLKSKRNFFEECT